jgi:hypothetical protein
MPAIRPDRLKREAEELEGLIDNPAALRWRVVDLLEFYADRTRRYGMTERIADATIRFRVPNPVMQALKSALVSSTKQSPENSLVIAQELWSVEVQEARLLAIGVLANAQPDEIIETIAKWVRVTRDSNVLISLANLAYVGLKPQGEETLRDQLEKWLKSRSDPIQRLAIFVLKAAASDSERDRVHMVFETLSNVGFRRGLITQKGYYELLEFLVEKNPAESAGYLLLGLKRGRSNLKALARDLLPNFPRHQRERIEHELS